MNSFNNESYKIKRKIILDNITFNIKTGEKVLILGKSGCGKSTIFNLLLKNIYSSNGIITYNNENIDEFNKKQTILYRQNEVIMISQKDDLFDNLTVYKNLTLFYFDNEVNKILSLANLSHLKDRIVSSLSGGERQRIAILKACLSSCEVLLCDEITSALDPINGKKILEFVLRMFKYKTIIFITHDKNLFVDKVDHIIEIDNHKIISDILIHDTLNIKSRKDNKPKKNLFKISFINGLKKISIPLMIIYVLSILCFFVAFNFNDIFIYFAKQSYQKYYDYDVAFILDNNDEIKVDNETIFLDISEAFVNSSIYINNIKRDNIQFLPFYNKEESNKIVINRRLLESQNINQINDLKIINDYFEVKTDDVLIIDEDNMFTIPCIYYDVIYYSAFLDQSDIKSTNLVMIQYDLLAEDNRFTNNPLFEDKKENKPYLDSKAIDDYLTFKAVFDSIYEIVDYYFVLIIIYALISSTLVNISSLIKDIKRIAIYISRGYSDFEITLTYLIPIFFNAILIIIVPIYYSFFLFPYLLAVIVQLSSVLLSYCYIKHKPLHHLLKEDTLC